MYQSYIFDFYGTLADIHTDENKDLVWEKLCLFYGYYGAFYTPEELKMSYQRLVDCGRNGQHGYEAYPEINIEEVFRSLFTEKKVQADRELTLHAGQFFRALSTEYICLYEGAKEMLGKLRKKGKRIYLLSNAQRIFTEYELRMLDIEQYFDGIMISSDYGIKKPDRHLFQILLEKYGLDPEESIMIGNDIKTDIEGARKAGIDTCYIRSNLSPEYPDAVESAHLQVKQEVGQVYDALVKNA